MARATPLLGHEGPFGSMLGMTPYNDVRFGLLGGSIVDANALLRSYIWHCIGIPIVASVLMIVHLWRVRKDGGISGQAPGMLAAEADKPRRGPKAAGEQGFNVGTAALGRRRSAARPCRTAGQNEPAT